MWCIDVFFGLMLLGVCLMWDMVLDYLGDMLDLQRGVIIFIEDVLFDIFG